MPAYAYAILVMGWLLWMAPFLFIKRRGNPAKLVVPTPPYPWFLACL
jgi:hypothetical protein